MHAPDALLGSPGGGAARTRLRRSGDLVTLCRTHPLRDRSFEGTVLDKGRKDIRLVMSEPPPGLTHGTWR